MPLKHDASDESRKANIEELIKAGHPPKQAVKISYDIQRMEKKKGGK